MLPGRLVDLGHNRDLHGRIQRHIGHADGQSRMSPAGAEHRVEQVGRPIEHLRVRMAAETRSAVHIAFDPHQTSNPIQITPGRRLKLSQRIERTLAGRLAGWYP